MDPLIQCAIGPLLCWPVDFQWPVIAPSPDCLHPFLWTCLVVPTEPNGKIFGFAEFVQALALLVIIYTISDVRHRFRIATAPIPLYWSTFIACGIIGVGTLLTDLLFTHRVPLPRYMANQLIWQAFFGAIFLTVILIWLWYAFIRRPVFGKHNCVRYAQNVYGCILRGSEAELEVIAHEIMYSAKAIVALSTSAPARGKEKDAAGVAHDLMLLLGSRKFCRSVIGASPRPARKPKKAAP